MCFAYAQLTYRESLRDIEACLRFAGSKLYPMGFRVSISRNTFAKANENRDGRIYADSAMVPIGQSCELDSTTIDLCLSVFPWAKFRKTKSGVKVSVLLDLRGNIPAFMHICPANVHEVKVLDLMLFEAGAFYIVDRGYFKRLYRLYQSRAFFVTRSKKNFSFDRRESRLVNKRTDVQFDQTVAMSGFYSDIDYPEPLRRSSYSSSGSSNTCGSRPSTAPRRTP